MKGKWKPVNLRDVPRDIDVTCVITEHPDCCLCHLRIFGSAGWGQKPPDILGIHLSQSEHDALDGRGGVPYTDSDRLMGLTKTLVRLHNMGYRMCEWVDG